MTIRENDFLKITFHNTVRIEDKRSGETYELHGTLPAAGEERGPEIWFPLTINDLSFCLSFRLEGNVLIRQLTADAQTRLAGPVDDPFYFCMRPSDTGLYPIGTGYAFPVDDPSLKIPERLQFYSGSSASMNLVGILRNGSCVLSGVTLGYDAEVRNFRDGNGILHSAHVWLPEKGQWGYGREVRMIFGRDLNEAIAIYRDWREAMGWRRSLRDKMRDTPETAKLRGAADCWVWDDNTLNRLYGRPENPEVPPREPLSIAAEMREAGMSHILWNSFEGETAEVCRQLKNMGFLVGKYDIYRDVIPQTIVDKIIPYRVKRSVNTPFWPEIVRRNPDGSPAEAWALHGIDGNLYAQSAVCDIPALELTMMQVPPDVKQIGYNSRLIDVQAGSELEECYDSAHPLTRASAARYIQMQEQFLADCGLVNGVEVGAEIFAAHYHYSEGMMSPPAYRANDAGRKMCTVYTTDAIPSDMKEYMLNAKYRIPLWQLVYHDCAVSYWYWGDSGNCAPELMPVRDLFCALYGEPPLYSLNVSQWQEMKGEIAASYHRATPVAELTFSEKMTSFAWLSVDRMVQRTRFANGVTVTANFSGRDFILPDGKVVPAAGCLVESETVLPWMP